MNGARVFRRAARVALVACVALVGCAARTPSGLRIVSSATCHDVGAAQVVEVIDDTVLVCGDADCGVIRACDYDGKLPLRPRRLLRLTVRGDDRISNPTGIAVIRPHFAFIGNSVSGRGEIHCVDWSRASGADSLEDAWLRVIRDDLSKGGTRPERIRFHGETAIATADYADRSQIRIYNETALASAKRTSDAGVLIASFDAPGWIQNLYWLEDSGRLLLVQNSREGLGWRLTLANLEATPPTFRDVPISGAPDDELKGAARLPDGRWLFITSSPSDNAWLAETAWENH
ncbi:MAG: hypothetical protein KDA32_08925 [Phycisphaerales bacterium]|nr:hypothetical protein [Phycisphaerales bacterium]